VIAHSDKEGAAGTFKKTYGHHLLTPWCDNTGECLVLKLRPGNAGSNTADDHIEVIKGAIGQLPAAHRKRLLITLDGAGSSHALVRYLDRLGNDPDHPERTVYYAVGFDVDDRVRSVVGELAKAEPKVLRYRVLHVAERIIRSGRRREVRIPETWPWADEIAAMFDRIKALPARA